MIWVPKPAAKNDEIMADCGFTIKNLLTPLGVKLNIPPFFGLTESDGRKWGCEVV